MEATRVAAVDRFFLLFDGLPPPPSCVWAFVLQGTGAPDAQRLRAAVAAAMVVHPKAAWRIARRSHWRPPVWERVLPADPDCVLEPQGPPAADERELFEDVVSRFHRPLDVSRGALLRLQWRRIGRSDGALVFHFHHALGDGSGSLAFLRDVIRAYSGLTIDGSTAPVTPPRLRLGGLLRYWLAQAWQVRFRAPDHVYGAHNQPTGQLGLAYRMVPDQALAAVSRHTVRTAVLAAACALAIDRFRRDQRLSRSHVRIGVSVSLRHPARRPTLDNQSAVIPISITAVECADPGTLAATIQQRLRFARGHHVAESIAALAPPIVLPTPIAAALVRRLARARSLDSMLLMDGSNLSVAREPIDTWIAPLGGQLRHVWALSRPAEGTAATLNVAVAGGAGHLSLCTLQGLLDRADAERLLDLLVASLEDINS